MERNCLMIYTIYQCPVSFCSLDSFCPHIILPWQIGFMINIIYQYLYHFAPCIGLLGWGCCALIEC